MRVQLCFVSLISVFPAQGPVTQPIGGIGSIEPTPMPNVLPVVMSVDDRIAQETMQIRQAASLCVTVGGVVDRVKV